MPGAVTVASWAAAGLLAAAGAYWAIRTLRSRRGDAMDRIVGVLIGLVLVGAGGTMLAVPQWMRAQQEVCLRYEVVNTLVGRVSVAERVCREHGIPAARGSATSDFDVRFDPPAPSPDSPFTVVIVGLAAGESLDVSISPAGMRLQPARVTADAAGEARMDFRVPAGGARTWRVIALRASGQSIEADVPFAGGAASEARPPLELASLATPDPTVTESTCAPSPAPPRTPITCTFVGLPAGEYVRFARMRGNDTVTFSTVDRIGTGGRAVYHHTYWVDAGEYVFTATSESGATASARAIVR